MDLRDLPNGLRDEIEALPAYFELRSNRVLEQVVLDARVRGVPLTFYLDLGTYPQQPPRIELAKGWKWSEARADGQIEDLDCLKRWNRTLGLGSLLRELENRLRQSPARKPREQGYVTSLASRLRGWIHRLLRSLRGQRGLQPEDIQQRYEELIVVKSDRLLRYREAVDQLVAQLRSRRDRAGQLTLEIRRLEAQRNEALEATRSQMRDLEATGLSREAIRRDEAYREGLDRFRAASARLEELQEDALLVTEETGRLEELVGRHKGRLEELNEGLRNLREEAAEKVAELTASQIEEELHEHQVTEGLTEELATLRQQIEAGDAARRARKELAALDPDAIRRELEASAASAEMNTDAFEALLGLAAEESSEAPRDVRRRESS